MTDTSKEAVVKVDQDLTREPDVKEGYVVSIRLVRFKPYKPGYQRQTGRKGRWHQLNEHGGWTNCPGTPAEIWTDFPDYAALLSERDAFRTQLQAARNETLEEVALWYADKGWLLDEFNVPDAIRALKSTSAEGEG